MTNSVESYLLEGCGRCPLGGTADCKVHNWPSELKMLRGLVKECGLTEVAKWGVPCCTYRDKNILSISALKEYCCLSFFKGALLSDSKNLFHKPGPNSRAAKILKFTSALEILKIQDDIKAYIDEAIEIEKLDRKFPLLIIVNHTRRS